jgi:hypothetical protein
LKKQTKQLPLFSGKQSNSPVFPKIEEVFSSNIRLFAVFGETSAKISFILASCASREWWQELVFEVLCARAAKI